VKKEPTNLRQCPDCGTRIEVQAGQLAAYCKGCDNQIKVRVLIPIEGASHERATDEGDLR